MCLALGFVHPDALLASLNSRQLLEWYAYLDLEPGGELRQDFRFGVLCATVANYAGKMRKQDSELAVPADFFATIDDGRRAASQTPILLDDPAEQAALLKRTLFGVK